MVVVAVAAAARKPGKKRAIAAKPVEVQVTVATGFNPRDSNQP